MVKASSKEKIIGDNYRFTLLTPSLIRMEYSKAGNFTDQKTQVVVDRNFPAFEFDLTESENSLEIYTDYFHLSYDKQEFTSQGLTIDMKSNFTDYNNKWFYGEMIDTLKGTTRTLDNVDGSTELDEGIISKQGYAVLDDSRSFIVAEDGKPIQYKNALRDFYKLTGPTPVIPRYALGNWWSRFWAYTDKSYLALMDRFKKEQIPLAVSVLDMDWHIRDVPERFGSEWTGYSWNKKLFPDPQKFLEELHRRGLKITLNVHPADGIRAFEDCYPAVSERLKLNVLLEEPAEFDMTNDLFVIIR